MTYLQSPPKPTPGKVKEEIERAEERVNKIIAAGRGRGGGGRTHQREAVVRKADDVAEEEEEEEGRQQHFQQVSE